MKIVIIEDEMYAARRLENMIREFDPGIEVVAWLESVTESIDWFTRNPEPDLIFLDVHLEDNLSFAIFDRVTVNSPVIFTTATDEVAVKAFVTRGIDFLHKPIIQAELFDLLEKYRDAGDSCRQPVGPDFFSGLWNIKP
jgi:DNA-binding LytR/AlgR family response regulator